MCAKVALPCWAWLPIHDPTPTPEPTAGAEQLLLHGDAESLAMYELYAVVVHAFVGLRAHTTLTFSHKTRLF